MTFTDVTKQKKSLGALRQAKKTKAKSPDLLGQLNFQRHTAVALFKEFSEEHIDEVVCNIAGWKNYDHSGVAYLTVELSPRFLRRGATEQDNVIDLYYQRPGGRKLKLPDPCSAFRLPKGLLATIDAFCEQQDLIFGLSFIGGASWDSSDRAVR